MRGEAAHEHARGGRLPEHPRNLNHGLACKVLGEALSIMSFTQIVQFCPQALIELLYKPDNIVLFGEFPVMAGYRCQTVQ